MKQGAHLARSEVMGGDIVKGYLNNLTRVCVHELEMLGDLLAEETVLWYYSAGMLAIRGGLVALWNSFQESRARMRQALVR